MNYKIVEVEWLDAQTHSGYAEVIGDLKDWNPFLTKSIGYLLFEDKQKIILGFMLMIDEREEYLPDSQRVKHFQMIPKGMIRKIKQINGVLK